MERLSDPDCGRESLQSDSTPSSIKYVNVNAPNCSSDITEQLIRVFGIRRLRFHRNVKKRNITTSPKLRTKELHSFVQTLKLCTSCQGGGGGSTDVRYLVKAFTEYIFNSENASALLTSSSHTAPPQLHVLLFLRHLLFQKSFSGNETFFPGQKTPTRASAGF